ncbi:MAG: hypothetical protein V1734_06715 [Nanoarchaeota archaeon]
MKIKALALLAGCLLGCGEEPRKPLEVIPLVTEAPACDNMPRAVVYETGYMIECGSYYFIHDESRLCADMLIEETPEIRQMWQNPGCDEVIEMWMLWNYSETRGDYEFADYSSPAGALETSAYYEILGNIGQKAVGQTWEDWL